MTFRKVTLIAAVCVLALPFTASAKNMKPGKWSMTFEMSGGNGPMAGHQFTMERCITPQEASSNEPPKARQDSQCKVADIKVDGNTVSWKLTCAQGVSGEGSATYSGDSYSGVSHIKMNGAEFTQKFSGKYVGPCEK